MRGCLIILVLVLAGCQENRGWNPNYQYGASSYGQYKLKREAALVNDTEPAPVVPLARPFKAPTAADISGKTKPPSSDTVASSAAQ